MNESTALIGAPHPLVAVLTEPEPSTAKPPADRPTVVFVNSGILHRPGPNRMYVTLARRLAARGHLVLRFDLSGLGDSESRPGGESFLDRAVTETRSVLDWLARERGSTRFVLAGLCSGAVIAYRTTREDERVVGAVLINGGSYFAGTDTDRVIERTLSRHYRRMTFSSSFRAKNWKKALRGNVDYKSILKNALGVPRRLAGAIAGAITSGGKGDELEPTWDRELATLASRGVALLALHSEGDDGLDYMHVILGDRIAHWEAQGVLDFEVVDGANHTFTLMWSQRRLFESIERWFSARWR